MNSFSGSFRVRERSDKSEPHGGPTETTHNVMSRVAFKIASVQTLLAKKIITFCVWPS